MVALNKGIRPADLEHLDRLEDKVKALVALVGRMADDQRRSAEERARLAGELETARGRIAELETLTAELAGLREEREAVRSRVGQLLSTLDALQLG